MNYPGTLDRENGKSFPSSDDLAQKLKLLIINTQEPFIMVDRDLVIVAFNNQFENLYLKYFGRQILRGASILDYSQKKSIPELKKIYSDVLGGVSRETELNLTNEDAVPTHFSVIYKPAFDETNSIIGAFVSINDITDKKIVQRQLQFSEIRFRALLENSGDMISLTDREGKILYLSPSFEKITGFSSDTMKGKSAFDIMHADYHEEARQMFTELLNNPGMPIARKNVFLNRKTGAYMHVEGITTNLLDDPNVQAIVANLKDVTEKIIADEKIELGETRFKTLIEHNYDGIVLRDENFSIIYSSASAERILGWTDEDKLGKDFADKTHPDDIEKVKENHLNVLRNPGVSFPIIFRTQHKKGHFVWVERIMTNMLHDKAIKAIVANFRDISAKITIEKELEYKEARLKQAQAIAHVGHWEVNFKENISAWSDEIYRIYGLEPLTSDFSHERLKEFIHPEEIASFENEMESAFSSLSDFSHEHRIIRTDRSVRHVVLECRFEFDSDKNPIGLYGIVHDRTAQKEAEEILKKSHELLQKLTDKVPVAIYEFELNDNGKMTFPFMSKAILEFVPHADISNLRYDADTIFEAIHPEDVETLMNSIEDSRIKLSDWSLEFRMMLPDNTFRWLHGFSRPTRKLHSTIWYGYLQDITESKISAEEIRVSKERYDLVTKATNEAIWDWDLKNNKLQCGEGFKNLFGHEVLEDFETIEQFRSQIHPEDRERVAASILKVIHSDSEVKWEEEYRYAKSDKSYADVLDRGYVIRSAKGTAERMIGAMQDITQRKLVNEEIRISKERYDFVAKATNDAIYDWDLVKNETFRTGDGIKTLFGYDPKEAEAEKNFWSDRIHPEDYKICYAKLKNLLLDPKANYCNQEYRFKKADGTYAYVYDKGFIIRNEEGKAIRMIGATQDISRNKKAELELKKLNTRLEGKIQERNKINSELKVSEEKYRNLFYSSPIPMWVYDPDSYCFLDVNAAACRHYGYTREEFLAMTIKELWPAEDIQRMVKVVESNKNTSNYYEGTFQHYKKNGELIQVNIQSNTLKFSGKSARLVISNDITEKLKVELQIKESNDRYNLVSKATSDAIWDHTINSGKIYIAGTGFKFLFGYKVVNAFVEKEFWEDNIHPEDRLETLKKLDDFIKNAAEKQIQYEYRFKKSDGSYAYVNDRLFIIRENGAPVRIIGAINDITKRKEEEYRLKLLESIITHANDAVMILEPGENNSTIIYVNQAMVKITGYSKEEIIGQSPDIFLGPRTDSEEVTKMKVALKNHQHFSSEIIKQSKDGRSYWTGIDIAPVTDISGKTSHMIAIERDITSRKVQEQEREKLIFELIQNNKDLRQFSYITSHNLRGPIANLLGLTNLLDTYKVEDPTLSRIMDGIKKAASNFDETIKDLSTVLNIKDRPSIPKENIELETIHCKTLEQCRILLDESKAQVIWDFSKAKTVFFNKAYIESIFSNLLTNAIKYRLKSVPLLIDVSSEETSEDVIVKYKDNGRGMDLGLHREKVFGLYQRFHDNTEGKGLGLFLVKSQLEAMGGSIDIDSRINEGTLFTLRFKKVHIKIP
ncbi:hypothetical protein CNR22_13080 [Sphingobacteriaceae bacterium]|nr:hypothetical protein CNR22_13080 [Sphingobacteriaceae bacterium]